MKETIATLDKLVAYPTVSTDSNLAIIDYIADRLAFHGAKIDIIADVSGQKASLWATLGPVDRDGGIVLSGHTDVVPVTDQPWSSDPFEMTERGGRLYGRGTCDMKGFIAACLSVAPMLAAKVQDRPVHFAFTHDEETGCLGAQRLVEVLRSRELKPKMAIIGEPTEMRVIEGHKGCYEYTTQFTGLEGHGSAPDLGVNAVEYAVRYISRLLELREDLKSRPPVGSRFDPPWSTINIGAMHGGVAHNVIAPKASVAWEMRPVVSTDAEFVKANLQIYMDDVLRPAMQSVHPKAAINVMTEGEVAGLEPMTRNAARDLVAALTGANGADVVPFGTEAGLFQSLGIDCVVCGPGSIHQAHKADEYIEIDQLQLCLKMLCGLAETL